jgi:predicted RNA polymerase sigma factor
VRMIDEGVRLLKKAAALAEPGPYQLQAAIVACHSKAASFARRTGHQILALYDMLLVLQPSPVIRLNRAIALPRSWARPPACAKSTRSPRA